MRTPAPAVSEPLDDTRETARATTHTLRVQARWLMEREIGRIYWRASDAFREQEAKDRVGRAFNRILGDEYMAVSDADPVAP